MRKYAFVIDRKGIESWIPTDLEVGTRWYGGKVYPLGHYLIRAAANHHRGCYFMTADIDEATEQQLIKLLKDRKDWKKGQRLIEKVTGRNFKTEGRTMDELRQTKPYQELVEHIGELQKVGEE